MNSSTCGKSWNGIRYYDKITLATLWPYSFKIRFVDGDDFSELVVRQQRKYYLSRESIPQKEGYVFKGWHAGRDCRDDDWRDSTGADSVGDFQQ